MDSVFHIATSEYPDKHVQTSKYSVFAHMKYWRNWRDQSKFKHVATLASCACAIKERVLWGGVKCHDFLRQRQHIAKLSKVNLHCLGMIDDCPFQTKSRSFLCLFSFGKLAGPYHRRHLVPIFLLGEMHYCFGIFCDIVIFSYCTSHNANIPTQFTANFNCCENDNFRFKYWIFSSYFC